MTTLQTDKEGFLLDPDQWTPELSAWLAEQEGIQLTSAHWEVLTVLRQFYQDYQTAPAMRVLVKVVRNALGEEKGNSIYLMQLFPGSPAKLASKLAGLPKPTNCL